MNAPHETINLIFSRENTGKLVFIQCEEDAGFMLTHKHGLGQSVRHALTDLLRLGFRERGSEAEVFLPQNINKKTFRIKCIYFFFTN